MANPLCTRAAEGRRSIAISLEIFKASASTCSLAAHASNIIAVLSNRLEELVHVVEQGSKTRVITAGSSEPPSFTSSTTASTATHSPLTSVESVGDPPRPSDVPLQPHGLDWECSMGWDDPMLCDSLPSWVGAVDGATWQTYQHGVDDFLADPNDVLLNGE